ncbi:MAG: MaoC family dehydratase, partial [Peptococcaceae bacterium]|nr:MaoC family dehydratase [Peptococcaceae bacterium]
MSKLTVDSKFVGVPWKEDVREITWRMTTNYAASLDDMNPLYFDEEQEGGLYASPMFPVTL